MKKVVIAGGTGFLGSYLTKRFTESGYEVLIISRQQGHVSWQKSSLEKALDGADLIINLAGKSINCRHTKRNRKLLIESRINPTIRIGEAIQFCQNPPKLWINASASGIYKPSIHQIMTEEKYEYADGFIAKLVLQWENTFFGMNLRNTRQAVLRTSVVLGKDGGALKPLGLLARLGLGGKQGKGNQMFSWIHIEDYFRTILFLIENESLTGVFNCTSPTAVTNEKFMFELRNKLRMPIGIPAPRFAIYLGAFIIGTEPSLILNSSNIQPKRLTDNGFKFTYSDLNKTLNNLIS